MPQQPRPLRHSELPEARQETTLTHSITMHQSKTGLPWADYLNAKSSQHKRGLPKSNGLRCLHCCGVHPYVGPHQLGFSFRYVDNQLTIIWICPMTGNTIEEVSYVPKIDDS